MTRLLLPALAILLAAAGPPPPDPDWPCIQRQVPTLTATTFWTGQPGADKHKDPAIAALVDRVAPRSTPTEQGSAALATFINAVPAPQRPATADQIFAGLVETTNTERAEIITRLLDLARRQRDLTKTVATVTAQLRALSPEAPAKDREEVTTRRNFLIRDFESVGRTVRYACEVPVQLEARLGTFAQTLRAALDQ